LERRASARPQEQVAALSSYYPCSYCAFPGSAQTPFYISTQATPPLFFCLCPTRWKVQVFPPAGPPLHMIAHPCVFQRMKLSIAWNICSPLSPFTSPNRLPSFSGVPLRSPSPQGGLCPCASSFRTLPLRCVQSKVGTLLCSEDTVPPVTLRIARSPLDDSFGSSRTQKKCFLGTDTSTISLVSCLKSGSP